jgi:hypothetical protein
MDLYVQDFGQKRVIIVLRRTREFALIEDVKDGIRYCMEWDSFFKHHKALRPYEGNVSNYIGPNLDLEDE